MPKLPRYPLRRINFLLYFLLCFSLCYGIDESVEEFIVKIPMRDGVELDTLILKSKEYEFPLPCILVRTPSDAGKFKAVYGPMTRWGYAVALQSIRSHSFPDTEVPFLADGWGDLRDGYDTVVKLAESPYTNGNIGTFGPSAMGITQLLLAPTNPPGLKCQYIQVATPSLYNGTYVGGKLCKHQIEGWFAKVAPKAFQNILLHPAFDAYWQQVDASDKADRVTVPALHFGGWYDFFSQGTLDAFTSWQEKGGNGARGKQKLIMGPWTHWGLFAEKLGEFPIPAAATEFRESQVIRDWFDTHLKNKDIESSSEKPVCYYVMGPLDGTPSSGNRWESAESWPPESQLTPFYFSSGSSLAEKKPFSYDPENPVSTVGGKNLYLPSGPYDQSVIETREDVLVFTGPVLKEDLEVTGRWKAVIYLSSSAPSADVAVSVTDVYPDGKSVLIAEGIQTITGSFERRKPIEVDLSSVSMVFAAGHRIRVNISGSNYPHFDKNPHPANNALHVGFHRPSHLLLPVIHP